MNPIAVIDPRILAEEHFSEEALLGLLVVLKVSDAVLPEPLWGHLQPLIQRVNAMVHRNDWRLRVALDTLSKWRRIPLDHCEQSSLAEVRVSGLAPLFRSETQPWMKPLEDLMAALANSNHQFFLLTSPGVRGDHRAHTWRSQTGGEFTMIQKTVWQIVVQAAAQTRKVAVIDTERHVSRPWTRRFDEALPAQEDVSPNADFPFCPPKLWEDKETRALATRKSRPCWIDAKKCGWAHPHTPGESQGERERYHWDVFLNRELEEEFGLSQLNITRFGAPADQGEPGSLHHVPTEKKGRLKKTTGWSC